jgi:hypothetical protein
LAVAEGIVVHLILPRQYLEQSSAKQRLGKLENG